MPGRLPELSPELLAAFRGQMQRITLRTLLSEMELCEENGMLEGATEEERYRYYEESFLGDPGYLREVYEAYPTMYGNMLQALGDSIRNIAEMLDRFAEDREGINSHFFPDRSCKAIRQIGGGSSDSHRHGHRVFTLELDNGEKLVYKSRSLAVDSAYEVFLRWVSDGIKVPFQWSRTWDRKEYGWCQWVSARCCHSREEMERYYYRNGILLCVSYLLGSEDFHYENLIACGEHPMIVDLEMAVGSRGTRGRGEMTGTERRHMESVLQSGLLPLYTWNDQGKGVNVGAINGKGGQLVPLSMPVVVDPGTVRMHIEYRQPKMKEGNNLATREGEFVEPYEFLGEIQAGFGEAYAFLVSNREEAWERLAPFQDAAVRYLIRDTQQYSMLLTALGHPDLLTGDSHREAIRKALENGTEDGAAGLWIREQELQELLSGDVPYFYYHAGGKGLYSGTGEGFDGYFSCTAMERVGQRLRRMCAADLERQQKLIRTSLLMGTKRAMQGAEWPGQDGDGAAPGMEGTSPEERESRRIRAAEKLADILVRDAIWSEDGGEVGWISIMMAGYGERSYWMKPMDDYLYGGLAGVAVFFAELAERTGKEEHRQMRKALVDALFRHTDGLLQREDTEKLPTGAYAGEASVAFAYMLLYSIDKDSIFLQYLWKQCQVTARGLAADREHDVLGGNAGAILVFLKAYHLTGQEQYMAWAREAGDHLLGSATLYGHGMGWVNRSAGTALTGFAHGTAGIMLALARLGHDAQEGGYLEAAYQAYRYEDHYYRERLRDWEDLRDGEGASPEEQRMAWCHGWGGIAMARMEAERYAEGAFKEELGKVRDFARRKVRDGAYKRTAFRKPDFCLCHGRCGNQALLAHLGDAGDILAVQEDAADEKERIVDMICRGDVEELLELQECSNYGLTGGIAGLGYGCLCDSEKTFNLLRIK